MRKNRLLPLFLSLPLLVSLFSCGSKKEEKVKVNIHTYGDVVTVEEIIKGKEYTLTQKNDFEHLNVCYEIDSCNHAIGEKIKIEKDTDIYAKYISYNQENYAVLTNPTNASSSLTFTSTLDINEYKKYEDVLGNIGTIYYPKDKIGKLDFTKENYPDAIVKEEAVDTTKETQSLITEISNIDKTKFNEKYSVRSFIKTKGENPYYLYINYMPYYNAVSVYDMADKDLSLDQTNETLNSIVQTSLNVSLSEGSPIINESKNLDSSKKVISSSTGRYRDGRISLAVSVDENKFSSMLNKKFGSITFNRTRVTSFTQTYNETAKSVSISFNVPEKTTTAITDNFYEGDYLEDESILLVAETDANGNIISAPKDKLLFTPRDIISVTWKYHSSRAKQANPSVTLKEGVDFKVENGYIVALGDISNGKFIPASRSDLPFVLDKQLTGEINSWPGMSVAPHEVKNKNNPNWYIPFTEGVQIIQLQLSVSYTHKPNEWKGKVQNYLGNTYLKNVVDKLKAQEDEVNVLFLGASNATGATSSGYLNIYPYMDPYMFQIVDNLSSYYNTKVNYENRASGGTSAIDSINGGRGWINNGQQIIQPPLDVMLGLRKDYDPSELKAKFPNAKYLGDEIKNVPDLVIINLGGNDCSLYNTQTFKGYIKQICEWLKQKNPNVCILGQAGMYTNPISANSTFQQENNLAFQEILNANGNGDLISIRDTVKDMVDTGKCYTGLAANNVNHFGDFITRVITSMFLNALIDR